MTKRCPICNSAFAYCAECGKQFHHGEAHHCDEKSCVEVNAPLDCECGYVVSQDLDGVLNYEMKLIPYIE